MFSRFNNGACMASRRYCFLLFCLVLLLPPPCEAATCSTAFPFTHDQLVKYVPTLLNVGCTTPGSCIVGAMLPFIVALGINVDDPCVRATCVQSVDILTAVNRGVRGSDPCFIQSGPTMNFCAYGRDIIFIDATIGTAMQATLQETNLKSADPRIRGNLALWLPEVDDFLGCTIPAGSPDECLRGVCGARTAVPGSHDLTTVPYGCWAAVNNPLLAPYGHLAYPGSLLSAYGRFVFSTDGLLGDGTFGYTRPRLNVDTDLFPYTVPYGILTAVSYGVSTTLGGLNGTNACGSASGVCPWDDVRGMFLPAGTPCTNFAGSFGPGDHPSPTCMKAACNGAGVCGTAINVGATCPLNEVTLGVGFESATNGGGAAGRAALDPRCFTAPPRCVQRSTSGAGIPQEVAQYYGPSIGWAEMALATSLVTILDSPAGNPLDLSQLEPYLPFSASVTVSTLQAAVASVSANTGYALMAPAVCAFTSTVSISVSGTDCTRSLSTVPGPPDPPPAVPACAIALDPANSVFAMMCISNFATAPPSASIDVDGILMTPPLSGTPTTVRVGVCSPQFAPVGTYASQPPNTPFVPPIAGAVPECVLSLCNGQGAQGMYARETGSFCGDVTGPPGLYSAQCAELRCSPLAACVLAFIPVGVSCVNTSSPCTVTQSCDGHGYCTGGVQITGCVVCEVDEDCVCTGSGLSVGWCRGGVCTLSALAPPQALPLRGLDDGLAVLTPLEPWQQEELLELESAQNLDHGYSYNFNGSEYVPRVCRIPARLLATHLNSVNAPCYIREPVFGICRMDGMCGAPAPLLRVQYNTTNKTVLESLRAAHTPCDNGVSMPGSFPCVLAWSYQGVFAPAGSVYGNPSVCTGTLVCTALVAPVAMPVLGTAPTVARFGVLPADPCVTCIPTPLQIHTASVLIGACTGVGTLTSVGWTCGPGRDCIPPMLTGEQGCDVSRLFYPILPAPNANTPDISLLLPSPVTYGPCVLPARCNPATGTCTIGFAPAGAKCPGFCGGWPPGVCNAAGACVRNGGDCSTNNTCLQAYCPAYARLDSGSFGILDVPVGSSGNCRTIPVELFPPGIVGTVTCNADSSSCTVGDTCNGAGGCLIGDMTVCPDAMNPCLLTQGCSPTFGRCLALQQPTGSICRPDGFCIINGVCNSNATCQTSTLTCPVIPGIACENSVGSCYGITAFTLIPHSPHGAFATVTITIGSGPAATLAVATIIDNLAFVPVELAVLGPTGLVGLMASKVSGGALVGTFDPALPAFSPPSAYAGVCVYGNTGLDSPCILDSPANICGTNGICVNGGCVATAMLNCTAGNTSFCQQQLGVCVESMGGCVYPPMDVGNTCGFFGGAACMGNFTCMQSGSSGPVVCAGTDIGCPVALAACQMYTPGSSCTSGCVSQAAADGTPCSCLPQGGTCFGACAGGACVLNGHLDPPPSLESMQAFLNSVDPSSSLTTNGTLSKSAVMIILGLVYAILALLVLCLGCLCIYDICLLGMSVDEPMIIRQFCCFLCVGVVLFLALILFTALYLNV